MLPAAGIVDLMNSMEDLDPAREPNAGLMDVVRGPLSDSVRALERRNLELPVGQDFHFYSNFQDFKRPVADVQSRVATLLSQLGSLKDVVRHPSAFPADVDEGYDWLVGVQDALLERLDSSLDKFHDARKAEAKQKPGAGVRDQSLSFQAPPAAAASSAAVACGASSKSRDVKVVRSKDKSTLRSPIPFHIPSIPRPQDKFDDAVDNSNTPFRHKAFKRRIQSDSAVTASGGSSAASPLSVLEDHARKLGHRDPPDNTHPLEEELTEMAYAEGLLDTVEVRKYDSLDDTPFTFVTTLKDLKEMAVKLRAAGEIAIDLENHHYRSYQGFVCLMQVSTRHEDFIVDTLDLRSHIGPCLGDIFADPTIKKVMHGADRDIVWFQRDFGIYVCNLFDTGQAARVLQLQGFGLAFLLEHFCGVHADKRYQLADWRIRPLPSEMIKYAREDTHYLLYMHDMLKQLLLDARANKKAEEEDPVLQVYKRSRDLCLQLYAKELFTGTSYQHLYGVQERKCRPEQLAVLSALYSWRDSIARKEDESTGFVLPNHLLLQLASDMPDDVRQLQSFVKGSHSFVARNASVVIEIIRQSKEKALKELQEAHSDLEEGEVKEGSPGEELAGDKSSAVSKTLHSAEIKETVLEVSSESQDQEVKTEAGISRKTLQTDSLVTPIEASTLVSIPELDSNARETTGSDRAGPSLTDARSEEGQSKLMSEVVTGSVVVSRSASSSLFRRKPQNTPSVPHPLSNIPVLKELGGTSEGQESPAILSRGPILPTGSSLHTVDQVLPEVFTILDDKSKSLDEREGSGRSHEIPVSERTLTEQTTGSSMGIQMIASATVEAVDRARDAPSSLPETSTSQVTLGEGKASEATSVDNDIIPAPIVIREVSENAPIIQAKKKPSKLGSLLGGRKRAQQIGPSESARDMEQAKIKTQGIESFMVLPFGAHVARPPDESAINVQHLVAGETKATTGPEVKLDDSNRTLDEETTRALDDETPERPASSTATLLPDILMFETEADEASPKESKKHRTWWPPVASSKGRHRSSNSPCPGPSDPAHDQLLDKPDGDRNLEVPMSLSETYRKLKKGKRNRSHAEVSFDNTEVPARDFNSMDSSKKRREDRSLVSEVDTRVKRETSTENKADFPMFNYGEARDVLGLENLYTENADETLGTGSSRGKGRGRGSKKGSNRPGIPLSKTAFDPLRRARGGPKLEDIRPGQRRQVFPQTGNRTAVFKQ